MRKRGEDLAREMAESDRADRSRVESLPPEAVTELRDFLARDGDPHGPCIWLDMSTRSCRYYNYRPSICRDFELGSEGCRRWRDECRING